MTKDQFLKLQIGMYVTDVDIEDYGIASALKTDFCRVENYDRMGRIQLQPLDAKGNPREDEKGKAFWIYYKDYSLKDMMHPSEFKEYTV